jgi:hypothetical protein
MTYTPTTWVDGSTPAINATNLNHIEQGIVDAGSIFVIVNHGTVGSTARPAGASLVYWVGTATPVNALPYDFWKDT